MFTDVSADLSDGFDLDSKNLQGLWIWSCWLLTLVKLSDNKACHQRKVGGFSDGEHIIIFWSILKPRARD
ncbi:hypothetical protein Peur_004379 [Populus x canadensis]